MKEVTWESIDKRNWTLNQCVKMLDKKYRAQINKMTNVYIYNEYVNEYEFYIRMQPILININNNICDCINDKFKGNYNYTYYEFGRKIQECEWCNTILLSDILDNCRLSFNLDKGKDFGKYFFQAIEFFTGNITNKMGHTVNKEKQYEVSLDMEFGMINSIYDLDVENEYNFVEFKQYLIDFSRKYLSKDEAKLFVIIIINGELLINDKCALSASEIKNIGQYSKREYERLMKSIKTKWENKERD